MFWANADVEITRPDEQGKEGVPAERKGFCLEAMVIFDDRNSKHADRYHKRRGLRVIITIEVRKEKAFVS